jgi:hypothetical protein
MALRTGRRLRARYAFRGAVAELERTLPLAADEPVLLHGAVRLRRRRRPARPAVVRLSQRRLAVLVHHTLWPDQVWELPRAAVRDVRLTGGRIRLAFAGERDDDVLTFTGWTGRAALDSALRDAGQVADVLRRWLAGSIDVPPAPRSHRRPD